ncbi:SIR2 family protein [Sorangium sp. So ce327]|uniref:SIR2 family NAD-dependent protein deacylase n=1 Tax=Sorangium sp. So ce327 TaxID=3133301 RepID=UPI003F61B7B8
MAPAELSRAGKDPALDELREIYVRGDVVLFVGAGMSIAAGLPSRKRLIADLVERARCRGVEEAALAEISELARKCELVDALSAAKVCLGPAEFGLAIERAFDEQHIDRLPPLAHAIGALRPRLRAALTTNLDCLLEQAFLGAWPAVARATPDLARRRRIIIKVHGTLVERSTWVLTREEYERAMHADERLRQALAALFNATTLVFVGYQLDDDEFDAILNRIHAIVSEQPSRHFAIVPADEVRPYRRTMLENAGVRLIAYNNADGEHRELVRILWELSGTAGHTDEHAEPSHDAEDAPCPFPGLRFFDQDHARFFLGRDYEISEATQKLGDTLDGYRRWLQIEGPTGAGKSSLARAGLVPAIVEKGWIANAPGTWRVAVCRPGQDPVSSLAHAVYNALRDHLPLDVWSLDRLVNDFRGSGTALSNFVRENLPKGQGILLVVDQLEEAFTIAPPEPRAQFDSLLAMAIQDTDGALYLVTTIRSDFMGRFRDLPGMESILNASAARYHLKTMQRPGLRVAIEKPARLSGLEWESGLVERILDDASKTEGNLPLVAHVLQAVWAKRRGKLLLHATYDELGGLAGALTSSADAVLDGLGKEGRERARKILLRLVKSERGAEDTRQTVTRKNVLIAAGGDELAERVLARLSGGRVSSQPEEAEVPVRLVVVSGTDAPEAEDAVDLVHEALIRRWETLKKWIEEHRKALESRDDLEAAANRWISAGSPPDGLPSGGQLAYFKGAVDADARAQDFLKSAVAQERRRRLMDRSMLTGAIVGAAVATIAAAFAMKQRNESIAQRTLAEQRLSDTVETVENWADMLVAGLRPYPANDAMVERILKNTSDLNGALRSESAGDPAAWRFRAILHMFRGNRAYARQDYELARMEFAAGLNTVLQIRESNRTRSDNDSIASAYVRLGNATERLGDFGSAASHYERGREMLGPVGDAGSLDEMRLDMLVEICWGLGNVAAGLGREDDARLSYLEGLKLAGIEVNKFPNPTSQSNLIGSHLLLLKLGKDAGDEALFREHIEELWRIYDRRDSEGHLYDHGNVSHLKRILDAFD